MLNHFGVWWEDMWKWCSWVWAWGLFGAKVWYNHLPGDKFYIREFIRSRLLKTYSKLMAAYIWEFIRSRLLKTCSKLMAAVSLVLLHKVFGEGSLFSTLLISKCLPPLSYGLEYLRLDSKSLDSGILHFIACLGWVNLNLIGCWFYNEKLCH